MSATPKHEQQAGQDDFARLRASLAVARRRHRYYEPVPLDELEALLRGQKREPIYTFAESEPWMLSVTNEDGATVSFSANEVYDFAVLLKELQPQLVAFVESRE